MQSLRTVVDKIEANTSGKNLAVPRLQRPPFQSLKNEIATKHVEKRKQLLYMLYSALTQPAVADIIVTVVYCWKRGAAQHGTSTPGPYRAPRHAMRNGTMPARPSIRAVCTRLLSDPLYFFRGAGPTITTAVNTIYMRDKDFNFSR